MSHNSSLTSDKKYYRTCEHLLDGRPFVIRSIRGSDKSFLQDCIRHLSPRSRYYRFFSPKNELTEKELSYFTELDFKHHVGLIATMVDNDIESPIGFAEYIVTEPKTASANCCDQTTGGNTVKEAEVAFAVEEEYQGQGVATALLKHLVKIALADGIQEFTFLVLSDNQKMMAVLNNCGLQILRSDHEPGAFDIHLRLSPIE